MKNQKSKNKAMEQIITNFKEALGFATSSLGIESVLNPTIWEDDKLEINIYQLGILFLNVKYGFTQGILSSSSVAHHVSYKNTAEALDVVDSIKEQVVNDFIEKFEGKKYDRKDESKAIAEIRKFLNKKIGEVQPEVKK